MDEKLTVTYAARILSVLSAAVRHAMGNQAPKVYGWAATLAEKLGAPEPAPRGWIPSDDQLAKFLDSLQGRQAEHVFKYSLLALNTLARPEANLELKPDQVDCEREIITLNPEGRRQTKKRRPVIRLTQTLKPWLEEWETDDDLPYVLFNGKPIKRVYKTFNRKGVELGFPELVPYSLRHKMATELRARRVDRDEVSYLLGHKDAQFKMTEWYESFDPRFLAEAAEGISEYLVHLNKLTDRDLLRPDTPNILPNEEIEPEDTAFDQLDFFNDFLSLGMVGGTGIEPVTPTMST
ncbi:MAG: tyrosine-type recombinase/integrase [Alphaproteobacteria bacterium]|nr:tyrosine-type recombinase/integrase [Alphaproteobacteria bacterium]